MNSVSTTMHYRSQLPFGCIGKEIFDKSRFRYLRDVSKIEENYDILLYSYTLLLLCSSTLAICNLCNLVFIGSCILVLLALLLLLHIFDCNLVLLFVCSCVLL